MDITYNIPHVFYPGSSLDENADALRILLDGLIRLNLAYLHHHSVPPLFKAGVVYGRTEIWDSIPALYQKKFGDCKSLTAARCAELRMKGVDAKPVFRFNPRLNGGGLDFHILVQNPDFSFEDPSKVLGMEEYERRKNKRRTM